MPARGRWEVDGSKRQNEVEFVSGISVSDCEVDHGQCPENLVLAYVDVVDVSLRPRVFECVIARRDGFLADEDVRAVPGTDSLDGCKEGNGLSGDLFREDHTILVEVGIDERICRGGQLNSPKATSKTEGCALIEKPD